MTFQLGKLSTTPARLQNLGSWRRVGGLGHLRHQQFSPIAIQKIIRFMLNQCKQIKKGNCEKSPFGPDKRSRKNSDFPHFSRCFWSVFQSDFNPQSLLDLRGRFYNIRAQHVGGPGHLTKLEKRVETIWLQSLN